MIKKGPPHGARHGNTERQSIYYAAHNAARRARKKNYRIILDRFLNSPRFPDSQTAIGWDEDFCARYDVIAAEDHSYIVEPGKNGLMDQRDDYPEAKRPVRDCMRSIGKGNTRHHPKDQVRQRRSQQFTGTEAGSERVDPKTGWRWHDNPSTSSSSSSWQAASWWKSSPWNER